MALKRREKILLFGVLIAVAIFLFDRFFDTPMNRKILRLKEEVRAAEFQLNEFALLAKGLETAEAEILRLEEERKGLSERTLRGEEFRAFLRHLARESDPLQMKVVSITPSEEMISSSEEKKGTVSPGARRVTVQLVLHSTLKKLEAYLKGIEESPFLVQVEGLQIERNEEIIPLLSVTLELKMYITLL